MYYDRRYDSTIKQKLIDYASKQARRALPNGNLWVLENYTLIVNTEGCSAQAPHIDVVEPNYQFGLMVSDGAPSTQWANFKRRLTSFEQVLQEYRKIDDGSRVWYA